MRLLPSTTWTAAQAPGARARHVGAQRGDEGPVGRIPQAARRERGQAPVLAGAVEFVGRLSRAGALATVCGWTGAAFDATGGSDERLTGAGWTAELAGEFA